MVLQEGTTYTFSQIIDLNVEIDSFLADSGYRSRVAPLSLATKSNVCPLPQFDQLRAQMRGRLPYVPLTNDAARRAFYVSPLLFAALDQASFRMHIDYPVTGGRLSGRVDFLLRGAHDVVVTCATETDMARALTQLAAQMIAVSERRPQQLSPIHPRRARKARRTRREPNGTRFDQSAQMQLFGAVTTGTVWQFARLERAKKTITMDSEAYLLPRDLERVVGIFVGLLRASGSEEDNPANEGEKPSWAKS